jgi:hypothetical protein
VEALLRVFRVSPYFTRYTLRRIRSNFEKFAIVCLDFVERYPEDAYKYAITLLSTTLLNEALARRRRA